MRIGIDIMGGDYAPKKTIHGAVLALNEIPKDTKLVLFGKKTKVLDELKTHNYNPSNFEIVDCSQVINMGENPTKAFRSKSDSSIAKGFMALAQGKIDGFASAGNTGAMFVGGFFSLKAIAGIEKVIKISNKEFKVYANNTIDIRPKISQFAIDIENLVISMQKRDQKMEDVFQSFTKE